MPKKNNIKNNLIISILKFIRLFQKKPASFSKNAPRILVVSTTALGDSLWSTPAISDIAKTYGDGYIACLSSKTGCSILKNNKNIDKLFLLKAPLLFSFIPLLFALKKENFQAIVVLHSSQRLTLPLCYLLNTSIFAATENINKGLDILLTDKVKQTALHEIDRRYEVLKCIDVKKTSSDLTFNFTENKKFIEEDLSQNIKRPLIVFHPGAKDLFRVWPKSHYISLGKMLYNFYGCTIAITGSKHEKDLVSDIAENIPGAVPYIGSLDLEKLSTLFKYANLIITGDTGPLHLACAIKTPVIALFAATDPKKFGPYNVKTAKVIKKEQTCYPCLKRKCNNPKCFLQITAEEVFDLCKKTLK